jgi:hypothetical protein
MRMQVAMLAMLLAACGRPVAQESSARAPMLSPIFKTSRVPDPVVKNQCRQEAEEAAVLTARTDKGRGTVFRDTYDRCMRRGAADHR